MSTTGTLVLPAAVAAAAVSLGALLAMLPRVQSWALGPVRLLAFIATVTVVGFDLLPDAVGAVGGLALLACVAGISVPWLIEMAARSRRASRLATAIAEEVSYLGLMVHSFGDGAALWIGTHASTTPLRVSVALAAHTIPVTALVVLHFQTQQGRGSALLRAAGLGIVSLLGLLTSDWFGEGSSLAYQPWLSAAVAGLLLHIITHDLRCQRT